MPPSPYRLSGHLARTGARLGALALHHATPAPLRPVYRARAAAAFDAAYRHGGDCAGPCHRPDCPWCPL